MMSYIHKVNFNIRIHEIDQHKQMQLPSIIKLMQEASMQQVLKFKISTWDLVGEKLSWVLIKKVIRIDQSPVLGQDINIQTYPAGFDRYFAYRDYKVLDKDENLLSFASSAWVLMDLETRKMIKIPERFYSIRTPKTNLLARPSFKCSDFKVNKIAWAQKIGRYHLDWNGHLNNSILNQIILSATDLTFGHFQVSYKSEVYLYDTVLVYIKTDNDRINFKAINATTDKIVALATGYFNILD